MSRRITQHFVQFCASYGSLRVDEAMEILKPICHKYNADFPEDNGFKEFVTKINKKLNQYDHDITFVKYPITKEEFIVFRTINSEATRVLNHLTEQDRNYFGIVLTTLSEMENYGMPEIHVINLTSRMPDKPLAKNRAETLLQTWKQVGYFHESGNILYYGPRTMVEFGGYLLKNFPDYIKECSLCKQIVLWDPSCKDCGTKFHSECIRKYLIKSSNCPSCSNVWNTSFVSD